MRLRAQAQNGIRAVSPLRGLNLERVLAVAMDHQGPFTRAELIQATGLSAPTVGNLASNLIRGGLIRDLGAGPSRGGRRPFFMEFNARHGFVAGIDLGATRTRLAVADLRGQVLAHRVVATPPRRAPAALLASIVKEVRALLREAEVSPRQLLAIGAGSPGVVDPARGMVVALAPNLKGWSNVPMAKILKRELGAPVVVENDVNLAILGERWRGAAHGHDTCAFITLGRGIGAGIVVNGELHHGHHFLAGEIALMCMGPQFVETDFGMRGCLETLAGLNGLASHWVHPARGDGSRWVGELFEAAEAGDRRARTTVQQAATLIGIAIANLSIVLDPSLIVLGGALISQGKPLVHELRHIVSRIIPTPPRLVVSQLHEEAPLWGSLLIGITAARERLREQLRDVRVAN
jgi:glucokinase